MLGATHLGIIVRQALNARIRRANIIRLADGAVLRYAGLLFQTGLSCGRGLTCYCLTFITILQLFNIKPNP